MSEEKPIKKNPESKEENGTKGAQHWKAEQAKGSKN